MASKKINSLNELFQVKLGDKFEVKNDLQALALNQCEMHNPKNKHSLWQKLGLGSMPEEVLELYKNEDRWKPSVDMMQEDGLHLVWVDGVYDSDLSQKSEHVKIRAVSKIDESLESAWLIFLQCLPKQEITAALPIALSDQWTLMSIQANATVHVHHVLTGASSLVTLNKQLQVAKNTTVNIVNHIHVKGQKEVVLICNRGLDLDQGSKVEDEFVEKVPEHVSIFQTQKTVVDREGQYNNYHLSTGGRVVRNYHQVDLNGKQAHSEFHGVCLGANQDKLDQTILLKHNNESTYSTQIYRNVARLKALTSFSSRVYVKQGVSNIQSQQLNHNLLIDKGAHMISEPELEIYADEVECAHGSTVGQIDEKSLFYMQSRGLSEKLAKALLIKGFIAEQISEFPVKRQDRAFEIANIYLESL
ncbi:MAG: SufD family Fe-S cluster assembly protein [Pseudomonadota bacterium]|nr:SufD family Fe-S cluster assembly protein [Pseudomonadota bacterium]